MVRVRAALVLLLVASFPAAAPPPAPDTAAASPLCFSTGAVTFQLAPTTVSADYNVKIAPAAADLRIELVEEVETADFALVDDGTTPDPASTAGETCDGAGSVKTVRAVDDAAPADVTVSLTRAERVDAASPDPTDVDARPRVKLFLHSTRFGAREAAAVVAAVRYDQITTGKIAHAR